MKPLHLWIRRSSLDSTWRSRLRAAAQSRMAGFRLGWLATNIGLLFPSGQAIPALPRQEQRHGSLALSRPPGLRPPGPARAWPRDPGVGPGEGLRHRRDLGRLLRHHGARRAGRVAPPCQLRQHHVLDLRPVPHRQWGGWGNLGRDEDRRFRLLRQGRDPLRTDPGRWTVRLRVRPAWRR